jgi:hypothetical protein
MPELPHQVCQRPLLLAAACPSCAHCEALLTVQLQSPRA